MGDKPRSPKDVEGDQCRSWSRPATVADLRATEHRLSHLIRTLGEQAYWFDYQIGMPEQKKGTGTMVELTISNEQKIKITLAPKSLKGKSVPVDGVPIWTVQSGDSTVQPAGDGLSADLISSDTDGDTTYLVEADADLGAGVTSISDTIVLHVVDPQAANLGITPGTPELK